MKSQRRNPKANKFEAGEAGTRQRRRDREKAGGGTGPKKERAEKQGNG